MSRLEQPRNRNGSIIDRSDAPEGAPFQARTSNVEAQANFSRSSSLQSMLKNTIETGNIGQFSVKPSQLPLPTKRTVPFTTGAVHRLPSRRIFAREYTENEVDIHQSPHYPYPGSTGSSSVVSSRQTRGKRSDQASPQGSTSQNERSYSMSQSSVIYRGVTSPQLPNTTRLQQQGNLRGLRPRSPFAYPTRLKRPGYRPSSPALSELHRDIQVTNMGGCRVAESRADSPVYPYTSRRAPSAWQQGLNSSDPSFRHHPPSPALRYNRACSSSSLPQRMPTPGPLLSLDQNSSLSSRESLSRVLSAKGGWKSRKSLSSSPVFYDYTEAFEDGHFPKTALPETNRVAIENMDNDYHQLKRNSSRADLLETSPLGEVRKSTLVGNADVGALGSLAGISQRASSYIPRRDFAKSYHGSIHKAFSADEGHVTPANLHHLRRKARSVLVESPNGGGWNGSFIASSHPKVQQPPFASLGRVKAKAKASIASSSHSMSSSESMYSMQSSSHHKPPILGLQQRTSSKAEFDSGKQKDEPPFHIDQASSTLDMDGQALVQPALRASSFDYWSDSEPSRIYAPTPERSLSSPSHRDRFSRIFSIGDALPDMDEVDVSNHRSSRCHIPERHMKERRIENSDATNASLFRTETLAISPPKVALAMRQAVIDRDVHEGAQVVDTSKKDLKKSMSMNQEERSLLKVSSDQVILKSNPLEHSATLRIRKRRRPALSLPVLPPHLNTMGIEGLNEIARNSVPDKISPAEGDSVVPRIMRHYPSLPSVPSFVSCSPPNQPTSATLSFSFKPLLASEMNSVIPENLDDNNAPKTGNDKVENGGCREKTKLRARPSGLSTDSLPGSRPWNIDASYPWTDQPPELEVTMPTAPRDSPPSTNKPPRFRLKIHRASSAIAGATKLNKHPHSLDFSTNPRANILRGFSPAGTYSRTPRPSITINQNNSSHASQMATRYSGNLYSPTNTYSTVSPSINLVPPSPGLNLEVRSFFSDDSSQIPPKGSLRKRISQLKAIATRTNSTEDVRGTDRGFLSSALGKSRASGRSSRQETTPSERMYNLRRMKWRIAEKVKAWFHRGQGKVRSWGGKMASKGFKDQSLNTEGT